MKTTLGVIKVLFAFGLPLAACVLVLLHPWLLLLGLFCLGLLAGVVSAIVDVSTPPRKPDPAPRAAEPAVVLAALAVGLFLGASWSDDNGGQE